MWCAAVRSVLCTEQQHVQIMLKVVRLPDDMMFSAFILQLRRALNARVDHRRRRRGLREIVSGSTIVCLHTLLENNRWKIERSTPRKNLPCHRMDGRFAWATDPIPIQIPFYLNTTRASYGIDK
jgi:hypothetical protein